MIGRIVQPLLPPAIAAAVAAVLFADDALGRLLGFIGMFAFAAVMWRRRLKRYPEDPWRDPLAIDAVHKPAPEKPD